MATSSGRPGDDEDRGRIRASLSAARSVVVGAGAMNDDELLAAIGRVRVGRALHGPLHFLADAVLLVLHSVLLLVGNWRHLVLELVPAVWIAVLWDWRFHVVEGNELVEVRGAWAAVIAVGVVLATVVSYWCNVAFVHAALGPRPSLRGALREAGRHRRLILGAGLAVGALHAWVSVRGPVRGLPTVTIGLGLVALLDLYLYSALPGQALGLDRRRASPREYVATTVTSGALSMAISLPGVTLALVAHALLGTSVLRVLGVVVLAVAVLLQVAASSSSRAVSMWSRLLADPDVRARHTDRRPRVDDGPAPAGNDEYEGGAEREGELPADPPR